MTSADVKKLFSLAVLKGASDIHLVVGETPVIRIDGELHALLDFSILLGDDLEVITKEILSPVEEEKFWEDKDFDASYELEATRFRVNFSLERENLHIVARVIPAELPTLEKLGMPPIVYKLLSSLQGLILVTGPTGCGKSTTLAAMINYINQNRRAHIVTLEDPIEYIFKSEKSLIVQRQLGDDMVTFASGLKHVLRQDPNIVMIGEMRDPETIATAITLAETGHLVLATLHTYSASQTIDRIIDSFPPYQQTQIRGQLSMLLTAVISQRLLPAVKGGRVAALEILIGNEAVSNLIRENKLAQITSVIETSSARGMITFNRSLSELYQNGVINQETAQLYSNSQASN